MARLISYSPLIQVHDNQTMLNFNINPADFPEQVRQRSQAILQQADELSRQAPAWSEVAQPLEEICEDFYEYAGVYGHLKSVADTEDLRGAYRQALPLLSNYHTALEQHQGLYGVFQQLDAHSADLTAEQSASVREHLRAFRHSGVHLDAAKRQKFAELSARKAELNNAFSENVLDSNQQYLRALSTEELEGLPQPVLELLRANAVNRDRSGHLATMDAPTLSALLQNSPKRALRAELRAQRARRASKLADPAHDNDANMLEILQLRARLAELAGFASLDEFLLYGNILERGEQVLSFLEQLAQRVRPYAERDFDQLSAYAQEHLGIEQLQGWDSAYVQERMSKELFDLEEEQLRAYFPLEHVLDTSLQLFGELFDFEYERLPAGSYACWHQDVQLLRLSRNGQALGYLYLDLYTRLQKNGGAWMNNAQARRLRQGELQLPVAYLVANFRPPQSESGALLSLQELDTLLHECGHCLHHVLTQVDVANVGGIRGVPLDGIEVPSQFMEYLGAHPDIFSRLSRHYQSGAILAPQVMRQIQAKRNFCQGLFVNQQLQYALFDAQLHIEHQDIRSADDIHALWRTIRSQHSLFPLQADDYFPNSFQHIFAGGYALGYYSYLYSEIQSADAFAYIAGGDGAGALQPERAHALVDKLLSRGGSDHFARLYQNFRGQAPELEAYLRLNGLTA